MNEGDYMKDINKCAVNDDDLADVSGGATEYPCPPVKTTYTINGYTYPLATEYCIDYINRVGVDAAIGFCNKNIYKDSGWDKLATKDAGTVCKSMFQKYFNSHHKC